MHLFRMLITFTLLSCSAFSIADDRFKGQILNILNWTEYMDPELIQEFEDKHGVTVKFTYYETSGNRDKYLAEFGTSNIDLGIIESQVIRAYERKGWITPLDYSLIPNFKHINPDLIDVTQRADIFAVPYFWGTVGIAYRADLVSEAPDSWMDLFQPDESLRGKILVIDDASEAMTMALKALGYSMHSDDRKAIDQAGALLMKQKPYVQRYGYIELTEKSLLNTGEIWMAQAYSGDALGLAEINENIHFVVPKEGSAQWIDNLVVFRNAADTELAYAFINYLNEPEVAARNAQYVYYATPNRAAEKLLPDAFLADKVIYPPDSVKQKLESYRAITPSTLRQITSIYDAIAHTR